MRHRRPWTKIARAARRQPMHPSWRRQAFLEQLEGRLLLTGAPQDDAVLVGPVAELAVSPSFLASSQSLGDAAEGEDAPDLVAFAKALKDADVKFYGADWCPFCTEQKQLFEDGATFLPLVEVTNPDRTIKPGYENIKKFPTWEFPGSDPVEGVLSLQQLSELSGVPIPQGSAPSFVAIPVPTGGVEVKLTSPLHIPIDAYDPNGGPNGDPNHPVITITAQSLNPDIVQATVLQGNRSMAIDASNFGVMVFQLFEDRAPEATGRLVELAESGFYDPGFYDPNQPDELVPVTFHRVVSGFVIQAGDQTGTGSGGSDLGDFDDDYNVQLQHNRSGVLSFAKSLDDTNDSQFFITDTATRFLDFNHSVAGQLVEGDATRAGIQRTKTTNNEPDFPVNIKSASIFTDTENGLVMLNPIRTGQAEVLITIEDAEGLKSSQTILVNVVADDVNTPPFLTFAEDVNTYRNTPVTFQITAEDIENDALLFSAEPLTTLDPDIAYDTSVPGLVTLTPPPDYEGSFELQISVRGVVPDDGVGNGRDGTDYQVITVTVAGGPESLDLAAESDSGIHNDDKLTNVQQAVMEVTGLTVGNEVVIEQNGVILGSKIAAATTERITVDLSGLSDGDYALRAIERIDGQDSGSTLPLDIVLDRTAPGFTSTPASAGAVGSLFTYNADTDEDADGVRYSLQNAPGGATIVESTGVLSWTPTQGQAGSQTFAIVATDDAGNSATQEFTVDVAGTGLAGVTLQTTDLLGAPITRILAGQDFHLQVLVGDQRDIPAGVAAAYLDLLFPAGLVSVNGAVVYSDDFDTDRTGTVGNGIVDELGAATSASLGGGQVLLATIPMRADAVGAVSFSTAAASTAFELSGLSGPVSTDDINFGELEFSIVPPFTAVDEEFSFNEDADAESLPVLRNVIKEPGAGDLVIIGVSESAERVIVTIDPSGTTVSYQPPANFSGDDTFTYRISDNVGDDPARFSEATVTIHVSEVNDDPTALDDSFVDERRVAENSTDNFLDVLENDVITPDVDETLRITGTGAPSNGGRVTIGGANNSYLLYSPGPNFEGFETFTYTVSDGRGGSDTATVTVEVNGTNDPPTANPDTFPAQQGIETTLDVLANDSGEAGETLRIVDVVEITDNAEVTISDDFKTILYKSAANFTGPASFVYTLSDGRGGENQARVTVNVAAVNHPPTANDDGYTVGRNSQANILAVLSNDSLNGDANESLIITEVSAGSQNGDVKKSADGLSILYSPAAGFTGPTETFTYTVSDGTSSDTATVTVTVSDAVSSIGGKVFIDASNPGVMDAGESPVSGVLITITSAGAEPVSRTQTTGPDGSYLFANLPAGSYTVVETQPTALQDGGVNSFTIDLSAAEDSLSVNFSELGRDLSTYSMRDLFASTRHPAAFAVVDTQTHAAVGWLEGSWAANTTIDVQLDNGAAVYTVKQDNVALATGGIPLTDPPLQHVVQHNEPMMVLRLLEPQRPAEMGQTANSASVAPIGLAATQTSPGDGEGEAIDPAAASQGVRNLLASNRQAQNAPAYEDLVNALMSQF